MTGNLIDTNILVYAYDTSEKTRHSIAKEIVWKAWQERGITSAQNLTEFYTIVTQKIENPLPATDALTIVQDIIDSENWLVIDRTNSTIPKAIELNIQTGIHFWDAMIAQVMLENKIQSICTENEKDFKKVPFLKVVNPFK